MIEASELRSALRTMRVGLEQVLVEHRAGRPLSSDDAATLRQKLEQHDQQEEWLRKNAPAIFAQVRTHFEAVGRARAELAAAMGDQKA